MTDKTINVFHLDDHRITRDGMRLLLSAQDGMRLIGDGCNAAAFFEDLGDCTVDILLLDIYLHGQNLLEPVNGFDVCARLRQINPSIAVVAHSAYDDADRVSRIMRAGARAFVSKKADKNELLKAIKLAHKGAKYICSETSRNLRNSRGFLADMSRPLENREEFFSRRERDVLLLLAQGLSTRQIATKLFVTEKTVETHRKNLVRKAKVKNSAQLVAYAFLRGFIR